MVKRGNLKAFLGMDILTDSTGGDSTLPLSEIVLPASQPRRYFDEDKIKRLSASIAEHGLLEPILVRPITGGKYELVAGERRYRAAQLLNLESIPSVIRELSDEKALAVSLIENLEREDLNPIEETEGILALLGLTLEITVPEVVSLLHQMHNEAKGKVTRNVTGSSQTESVLTVFESVGQNWQSFVRNKLPLLKLPQEILDVLRSGQIEYTKAKALAKVKDEANRQQLLTEAVENNLSLTQIKERIKELQSVPQQPDAPQTQLNTLTKRINKSKLWEKSPKKWKRVQTLLQKMEAILEEE